MTEALAKRPWLGPVLSATLLAFAFAGAWPLVFIALVPWLLRLRDTTPRQAWNRGYAFGLLFSLTQLWWLGDLAYKWIGNPVLGVVPWLLAALASAVYYGLLGRLIRSCYGLTALWAIPLVWAGMEVFRSYIPVLAFPWALLGESLVGTPLVGLAWYGTIYLVSAFVVGINVVLIAPRRHAAAGRWLILASLLLWTFWPARRYAEKPIMVAKPLLKVAAGQPGVDMGVEMALHPENQYRLGPAVDALSAEAKGTDLLVLPEGIARGGASIPPATNFRVSEETPVVFGGQRGLGPVYQSAFAHDARGWTVADKTRLVIFGEFVPGRDLFPFIGSAFHLPGGDMSAGDKLKTVRAGRLTVGPLICFEGLFPDLGLRQAGAGADLLAVMSIDDWFAPIARERLARAAQWRAVEAGLPLVRAGSMGRTMVVSSKGEVVASAPYGERRLVRAAVYRGGGPFPLVWLFPLVALGSLAIVPLAARRRARAESQ